MANVDGVLFIDANQYVDLYRTHTGKNQLPALKEQQEHIFVTKGVVDEVQRNKVKEAAEFLEREFKKLQAPNLAVPVHLFSTTDDRNQRIRDALKKDHAQIDIVNEQLMELAHDLLDQITRSEDEVSKTLDELFAKAILPTEDELQRARMRKELGNAAGKKTGPLGDQLTWEQLLSRCQGKSKLWIITGDGDYATEYKGKMFLNAMLYQDLARLYQRPPEVFPFNNILDGIKHFAEITKVKADKLPTPEETEQIKKELDSLPPRGWVDTSMDDAYIVSLLTRRRQQMLSPALRAALYSQGDEGWHPGMKPDPEPDKTAG